MNCTCYRHRSTQPSLLIAGCTQSRYLFQRQHFSCSPRYTKIGEISGSLSQPNDARPREERVNKRAGPVCGGAIRNFSWDVPRVFWMISSYISQSANAPRDRKQALQQAKGASERTMMESLCSCGISHPPLLIALISFAGAH